MTMCPIPWKFQAVRNNGDVRLCCQANVTKNQGVVRKDNGEAYNAGRDDLSEAWNAELMRNTRRTMLNDEWPDECGRCKSEEEAGVRSRRENEMAQWKWSGEQAGAMTSYFGWVYTLPVYFDLRFGNMCNLACRMCGPTDSHQWYKEWTEFFGEDAFYDTQGRVELTRNEKGRLFTADYDWHDSELFWENLDRCIPNMKHVYMAGGEPLIIARQYDFLKRCVDLNAAKNIVLEYNTNLTMLPNRLLEDFWPQFKEVRIGASIDGMGAMQEYQRWPSKWSQIERNLERVNTLCEDAHNVSAWIATTITSYNVFHLPEFMWWKFHSGLDNINTSKKKPIITTHIQHQPYRTSIQSLPASIKEQVTARYADWGNRFAEGDFPDHVKAHAEEILNSTQRYMVAENRDKYLDEFVSFTQYLDKSRQQNIVDVVPEFGEIFDR